MSIVKIKPYIIDETADFTFANVTSTGNLLSNNANLGNTAVANFFIGYGNNLSNIVGANVTGQVSFAAVANLVAVGNVSGIGNIATINIDGNSSNILYGNGSFASAPITYGNSNVATFLANYGSNTISTTGNITAGNIISNGVVSANGNVIALNANLGNAATANFFIGSGNNLSNIQGSNVSGQVSNASIAGTVYTNSQPNITSVGTLTSLSISGNANIGNVNTGVISASGNLTALNANLGNAATANFFIGSGNNLSNIQVANVTGLGNIATINLDGNTSNVLYGNGVFAPAASPYGNSNVATFLASYGSNTITTTGNVSFGNISGTGLTAIGNVSFSGANVDIGNVSNLHISGGTANYVLATDGSGNLSWVQAATGTNAIIVDNFTGNGVQTIFTLSVTPNSVNDTSVNYNGATLIRSSYNLSGADIIFSSAPANNSQIEVTTISQLAGAGPGSFITRTATGNGIANTYTVSSGTTTSSLIVTLDGIVQTPVTDYTVTGTTLTFSTAPDNNVNIQIRELGLATTDTGITTGKAIAMAIVFGF